MRFVVTVVVAVVVSGLAPAPPAVAAAAAAAPCGPVVSEPLAEPPWPLARLAPELAWPLSTGAGMTVAVIDSGVSPDHPALAGKVLPGRDFIQPGGTGQCDEHGHGTLIAGIVAGRETTSAGYRFVGMAPDATIVPVRVLRDQRRSFEDDMPERIATAIRWVIDTRGADVINLSLTTQPTAQLAAAVRYALDRRVVVVAAAGNQSGPAQPGQAVYPAAYPGVIGVAGVDEQDQHVASSAGGGQVDVAAPGVRIAGPAPAGGGYVFSAEGGTSFAAGYVSGVAALIRAYDPELTPDAVARRITETADHPADIWNADTGYGMVNPQRAVAALRLPRAGAGAPAPRVAPPVPAVDPLRGVSRAAAWIAFGGALAAVLVLLGRQVIRRGRVRRWRPGRRPADVRVPP